MQVFDPQVKDKDFFAARMTEAQFGALKAFMPVEKAIEDAMALSNGLRRRHLDHAASAEIRKWLFNGWNTEHILAMSDNLIEGVGGAVLQWAFPQAYYACFASLSAFNAGRGSGGSTHQAVMKRFALDVKAGYYPACISFGVDSTHRCPDYFGIDVPVSRMHSLSFDQDSAASIAQQIVQFLRSTRKTDLDARKAAFTKMKKGSPIQTKSGKPKLTYREQDWEVVASRVGPTALLNLLYRKRIKSNYRDIDTFTEGTINPEFVQDCLKHVVFVFLAIQEIMLAGLVGRDLVLGHARDYVSKIESAPVSARLHGLESL